ncbi:ABC transporter ATP-binding protein [Capnocytophaga sp.]|uniref:ATP-binding cassette domain-containing protein n=1 Tax=Capnocytophaga sp. TaxID=44737 RepID=UPI0026DD8B3F|nr:ABC transporter ATP-binding protein [Capnocytophaga sp.]MDO5105779.1 ABC transporter ATP-binding protein [Capnocytophaga sp.]
MLQIDIQQKNYGTKTILESVSISVEKAGLYGIVGKNGSGKTTFFKCLSHLTDFQGKINYNKKTISAENIAFLPTEPFLYEHLTVNEFLKFYARLLHIENPKNPVFNIDSELFIKELSTGMRKKTYLNAVFQKMYDIYVFDEPFNGLDIESVYELGKIILQLSENHIVFVSSHLLESLQNCRCIFVLKNGNLQKILPDKYHIIESILFGS